MSTHEATVNDAFSIQVIPNTTFFVVEQSLSASIGDLAGRVLLAVAHCADVLALSHASASGNIGFVVPGEQHEQVTAILRRFAADLAHPDRLRLLTVNDVALVTVGDACPAGTAADVMGADAVQRTVDALAAQGHNILMVVQGWRTGTLVVQASTAAIWAAVRPA
jgi:hypothetical protein